MLRNLLICTLLACGIGASAQTKINLATQAKGLGPYIILGCATGSDLGACIAAADQQYAGTPATFALYTPGTISTSPTLSAQHNLFFFAPVTFNTYIIPTQDNTVQCFGATLTNGGVYQTQTVSDGTEPWFYAPAANAEVERLTFRDCPTNGNNAAGYSFGALFDSAGPTQDVTIDNVDAATGFLYGQDSAPANNPTLRLKITHSRCHWATAPANGACVLSYGASKDFLIDGDYFDGYYGVEMYASATDGTTAPGFPNLAQIQSTGLAGGVLSNNNCGTVQACLWTSMADRITMIGNSADVCNDVCFDVEGGSHHLFASNHCVSSGNGCIDSFFSSYQNSAIGNQVDGCAILLHIFNSSVDPTKVQDWVVENNVLNCPTGVIAFYVEASQNTHVRFNKITNGTIALPTYESGWVYEGNEMKWTVAVPTSAGGGGSPPFGGAGLVLPNFQDSVQSMMLRNTITTTVTQSVPCIAVGISDPNGGQVATLDGNICTGWANDLTAGNSGGNTSTSDTLNLRNNQWDSCPSAPAGNFVFTKFGNYVGSTGAACN